MMIMMIAMNDEPLRKIRNTYIEEIIIMHGHHALSEHQDAFQESVPAVASPRAREQSKLGVD